MKQFITNLFMIIICSAFMGISLCEAEGKKGIAFYEQDTREVAFTIRIQTMLTDIDKKVIMLRDIIDNEYSRLPKNSNMISMPFADYYRQMILRKALGDMQNLFTVCSTCETFTHFINQLCAMEGNVKEDITAKAEYYKMIIFEVDNFLTYLESRGIQDMKTNEDMYKREFLQEIAPVRNMTLELFIDLRKFYKKFLVYITAEANSFIKLVE